MTGAGPVERWRRARADSGLAILEGFHPLKHALRFGAAIVETATPDPAAVLALAASLAPDLAAAMEAILSPVDPDVWSRLLPRPPATGVAAIARRPDVDVATALADPGPAPVVLLDRPRRLGNVGAVIRVAAAAGAAGVLTTGSHDPWDPAALRGAAGLHWAVPVARVDAPPASDRPLVAIDPGGEPPGPGSIPPRAMLAFGTERHGLEPSILEGADARIGIPMRSGVSSLNLATAVAVVLYAGPVLESRRPTGHIGSARS